MVDIDLKIFGREFTIRVQADKADFYRDVAAMLDQKLRSMSSADSKSDIKTVIKTAFLLLVENQNLQELIQDIQVPTEDIIIDIENKLQAITNK